VDARRAFVAAALLCALGTPAPALAQAGIQRGAPEESLEREDAKKPWIKLKEEDAAKIQGVYLISAIAQDDVRKQTERYIRTQVNFARAPSGGGLIGAIIGAAIADAIINNQVQQRLERATLAMPVIMDAVKDFDFREEFWQRLGARLESETRFMIADDEYLKAERGHIEVPEQVGRVPVDAVLDLDT
jgi:glucose/arabinose dehydrogenase